MGLMVKSGQTDTVDHMGLDEYCCINCKNHKTEYLQNRSCDHHATEVAQLQLQLCVWAREVTSPGVNLKAQ